jgi:bacillolysin
MTRIGQLFIFLVLFIGGASITLNAQQKFSGDEADKRCKGSTLIVIGKGAKVPTFIQMGETSNHPIGEFYTLTHLLLSMSDGDDLKEAKKGKDYLGFVHHHYDQMYKGLPVEGAEYVMHEKNGRIITLDGFFVDSINVNTTATVTPKAALDIALKNCAAKKYRWEDLQEEANLRKTLKDSSATRFPSPELCIASRNLDLLKQEMHLCYRIDIQTSDPPGEQIFFVDAITAEMIGKKSVSTGNKQK